MSVPKPLTHNVNDALWHACRLGNEDAVKWALGLEVGEGQLYYAEEFWEVRKLEGYLTKEKGYDRNYSPAFGQTAAHIASLEGHRSILENYLFTADGGWSRTKPDSNGQTPADLAFLGGYPDLADWIRGLQAPPSNLHALLMQKTIEDCDKIMALITLHPDWVGRIDSHRRYPIHLATGNPTISYAVIDALLEKGLVSYLQKDASNWTPLDYAMKKRSDTAVLSLLLSVSFDISFITTNKVNVAIVEKAIRINPNVIAMRNPASGGCPIHDACAVHITTTDATFANYMLELVQLLYANTPDHVEDQFGRNRLAAAMSSTIGDVKNWAEQRGLLFNRYKLVEPIDAFHKSYGSTAADVVEIYLGHDMKTLDEKTKRPAVVCMKFTTNCDLYRSELTKYKRLKLDTKSSSYISNLVRDGGIDHNSSLQQNRAGINKLGAPSWETDLDRNAKTNCLITKYSGTPLRHFLETRSIAKNFYIRNAMKEVKSIAEEIANVLGFFHSKEHIHGNVNPSNLLYLGGIWRVCGIRYCKSIGSSMNSDGDTRRRNEMRYLPPEFFQSAEAIADETFEVVADETFDVWSFGCILYELACGSRPLLSDNDMDSVAKWTYIDNERLSYVFENCVATSSDREAITQPMDNALRQEKYFLLGLIKECLIGNPKERMKSFTMVLKHPYFNARAAAIHTTTRLHQPTNEMYKVDGNYGFIVSVGDYDEEGGFENLRCSFEDADLMRKLFISQGCEITHFLVDESATKEDIERSFSELKRLTRNKVHGRLLVYIKCKTYRVDGAHWLCAFGADQEYPYASMINSQFLLAFAETVDVTHQCWMLDFVGSATLLQSPRSLPSSSPSEQVFSRPSICAISSVGNNEKQHYDRTNSLFVMYLGDSLYMIEKEEFMGTSHNKAAMFHNRAQYCSQYAVAECVGNRIMQKLASSGMKQTVRCLPLVAMHKGIPCDGSVLFFPPDLSKVNIYKPIPSKKDNNGERATEGTFAGSPVKVAKAARDNRSKKKSL